MIRWSQAGTCHPVHHRCMWHRQFQAQSMLVSRIKSAAGSGLYREFVDKREEKNTVGFSFACFHNRSVVYS